MRIEAGFGHISTTIQQALDLIAKGESKVEFDFNDILLTVRRGDTVESVTKAYDLECERHRAEREAFRNSLEGKRQEAEREAAAEAEYRKTFEEALQVVSSGSETQMREAEVPWFKSKEDLDTYIEALAKRQHTYGTCPYAMSMAALATFNFMGSRLGVTGFQASFADMDFLRRTRNYKMGFQILDINNLLYPQYLSEEHFPSFEMLLKKHAVVLAEKAAEHLAEEQQHGDICHPEVRAHWERLVASGMKAKKQGGKQAKE